MKLNKLFNLKEAKNDHIQVTLLGIKIKLNPKKLIFIEDTFRGGKRTIYFFGSKISYTRKKNFLKIIPESKSAHKFLDGLRGIEIGGTSYAPWGLNTLNIDFCDIDNHYSNVSKECYNIEPRKVDIVSFGDNLPFKDNVWDFVINSHALEHFWDPIAALNEWMRVIKPNGYIYMNIPHKDRTNDKDRPTTTIEELEYRHTHPSEAPDPTIDCHHNVWRTQDFLDLCKHLNLNVIYSSDKDDRDGKGFTVVIQKESAN